MSRTEFVREDLGNDIQVIGEGDIGEKARQLVDKTPMLKNLGFHTPRTVILAEDCFAEFFQRNGLGQSLRSVPQEPDLEEAIRRAHMHGGQFELLKEISQQIDAPALVIRSSGQGDARGTGIYTSEFTDNNPARIRLAVQKVLASYFSPSAVAFREDAKVGEGFGVIIQPLIGQNFEWFYAPVISGFGYTSTLREDGYINVVPGIGGGVETRDGERIAKKDIAPYDSLIDYFFGTRESISKGFTANRRAALLGTSSNWIMGINPEGNAFSPAGRYKKGEIAAHSFNFSRVSRLFRVIDLKQLLDKADKMEQVLGKSQYFEWAVTATEDSSKFWLLQIADVDKKADSFDFEDFGEVLYKGNTVTGSGVRECSKIVFCSHWSELKDLAEFNRENRDYALIFSSSLTTRGSGNMGNLEYEHCHNAAVFIEMSAAVHALDPLAHFQGLMDTTDKLFARFEQFDLTEETVKRLEELGRRFESYQGNLRIFKGKFKVVASERQNRLVVYAQD